ncbi:bifunctional phosphopantothenoylcysteine decarboxylase/phosphopantothenate--cysteine ligase CoaBC [Candidatus Bathyarchaeota archaeon]|nr:bifunctional phosphopantothenoylcysteine decarboxylase/phosphopantothenate--cysteine ligase CoaBC [Candidatus Bathyarchaeota archaeon]
MSSHPSKDIVGTEGKELIDKRIVLCVTGSVAAVKCSEIARTLMRHGATVFAVMSPMAQKLIHPYLLEWATGNPVVTELTGKVEHVALVGEHPQKADLVLVAPATANTISKMAYGIDDTPVTSLVSTAIGSKIRTVVVPAMHQSMYNHPILTENIRKLKNLGIEFVGPRIEEEKAKIAETDEILDTVIRILSPEQDFSELKVLVTAGPTIEHIDPVRVITNRSSGKMGVAIVEEALARGAAATLVYGLGKADPPSSARVISVETTEQMRKSVTAELKSNDYDVAIAVAAPADWTVEEPHSFKIPTRKFDSLELSLRATPKIVDQIKKVSPDTYLVAFRAGYKVPKDKLIEDAYEKLVEANADLVVANDVGKEGVGFETDTNEVFIIDKSRKVVHVPLSLKSEIAKEVLNVICKKLKQK